MARYFMTCVTLASMFFSRVDLKAGPADSVERQEALDYILALPLSRQEKLVTTSSFGDTARAIRAMPCLTQEPQQSGVSRTFMAMVEEQKLDAGRTRRTELHAVSNSIDVRLAS